MVTAKWVPSPNYSSGRTDRNGVVNTVDLIVIHYIVGTLAAADQVFTSTERQVSAHYGIGEGEVHQYVKESDTAWHAGNFTINTKSIGIEHSADPNRAPDNFTYQTSIQLCIELCQKYGLDPRQAIVPHKKFIATQCPGTVDINRIIEGVAQGMGRRTYRPDMATNRDAMAAFLYRLSGSPAYTPPTTSPFIDIPTNHVFYKEISWMRSSGISNGWPAP